MRGVIHIFCCAVMVISSCNTKKLKSIRQEKQDSNSKLNAKEQFTRTETWNEDSTFYKITYNGPEFTKNGKYFIDAAHQTSNAFTDSMGNFLKASYRNKKYRKLDLAHLTVSFKGEPEFCDSSQKIVEYTLTVPILRVSNKNAAMFNIDHRGTWVRDYKKWNNHTFSLWEGIVAKTSESAVEAKLINDNNFRELWLQWRDLESLTPMKK
jgi:hypothetical protein